MKKKKYIALAVLIVLLGTYYYWNNRYVELRPVVAKKSAFPIIIFDNDHYKIAEPNEVSPNYYKYIKWVLDRSSQDYIEKSGVIYIKYKYMNDMNLIWNYTTRTNSPRFFKQERKMDSLHLISIKEYTDSQKKIIDAYLNTLKKSTIK